MATHDDDTLTGSIPDPDAEPSPGERAHARRFAELVDKALLGRTPPAMPAEDRALLEVATVIRATRGHLELAADRQRAIAEAALRDAIGAAPVTAAPIAAQAQSGRGRGRDRGRDRWAPWTVAGASALVAAAAIAVLWLRPHPMSTIGDAAAHRAAPAAWRSRPTDPLIGPIARDRAGDASARLDAIFADRLDGFRAQLGGAHD